MPQSASASVVELFVPEDRVEEAQKEASELPKLEISKLDTQWLQVSLIMIVVGAYKTTVGECRALWGERDRVIANARKSRQLILTE